MECSEPIGSTAKVIYTCTKCERPVCALDCSGEICAAAETLCEKCTSINATDIDDWEFARHLTLEEEIEYLGAEK